MNLDYKIKRMKRKSVALYVLKDGTLEVRAPHRVSETFINDFVTQKKDWVIKVKNKQSNYVALPEINAKDCEKLRFETSIKANSYLSQFSGKLPVKVNIRKQKSVWGTCNKNGTISINLLSCLLPDYLFEYIMIHELCHLIELNHSPKFWTLVSSYLPDWKTRRTALKNFRISDK